MSTHALFRVLIVEDDEILRRSICRLLREWSAEISEAPSLLIAQQLLASQPDLIILDIGLPDGNGVQLAEIVSQMQPMPMTIVMSGQATAQEAFHLKELGVIGYLQKPLSLNDFVVTIDAMLSHPPSIEPLLKSQVGRVPFQRIQQSVRKTMLEQAISISKGNRTHAARLLNVSRQAIQQMIHEFEIDYQTHQNR